MAHCTVPVSAPVYSPPIDYNSDLFGAQPSLNNEYNCDVQGGQYPYAEQDHLALRHLAFRNFVRPRTLDGKTVFKPVDEEQFSCECNLPSTPWTSKYNNETLKFQVKSGVIKRGCDCIKRNGLQDQCSRVRHENRWECVMGLPHGCTSGPARARPHYDNHLHRVPRPPYSNPCERGGNPRCVRSQILPNNGCNRRVRRTSCRQSNMSTKSQQSSPCLSKNNNKFTNGVVLVQCPK